MIAVIKIINLFLIVLLLILCLGKITNGKELDEYNIFKSKKANSINLMPLGDSITYGCGSNCSTDNGPCYCIGSSCNSCTPCVGGYRDPLWRSTPQWRYQVEFVGSVQAGAPDIDRNNEGHPGWTITQINGLVSTVLPQYQPNIILLHIGTNDIFQGASAATCIQRLIQLLGTIFNLLPTTQVLLASIIDSTFLNSSATIQQYNSLIPAVVTQFSKFNISFVDMYNSGVCKNGTSDCCIDHVHPFDAGYQIMAETWLKTLNPF